MFFILKFIFFYFQCEIFGVVKNEEMANIHKTNRNNFFFSKFANLSLITNSLFTIKRNRLSNDGLTKHVSSELFSVNDSTHSSPLIPRKQQNQILKQQNLLAGGNSYEIFSDYSYLKNELCSEVVNNNVQQRSATAENTMLSNLLCNNNFSISMNQIKRGSLEEFRKKNLMTCDSKGGPAGCYPSGDKIFRKKISENKEFRETFFYYVKQPSAIAIELNSLYDGSVFGNESIRGSITESYHDKEFSIGSYKRRKIVDIEMTEQFLDQKKILYSNNKLSTNNIIKRSINSLTFDNNKELLLLSDINQHYKSKSCHNLPQTSQEILRKSNIQSVPQMVIIKMTEFTNNSNVEITNNVLHKNNDCTKKIIKNSKNTELNNIDINDNTLIKETEKQNIAKLPDERNANHFIKRRVQSSSLWCINEIKHIVNLTLQRSYNNLNIVNYDKLKNTYLNGFKNSKVGFKN